MKSGVRVTTIPQDLGDPSSAHLRAGYANTQMPGLKVVTVDRSLEQTAAVTTTWMIPNIENSVLTTSFSVAFSGFGKDVNNQDVNSMVSAYNTTLNSIQNEVAPEKMKVATMRQMSRWYNDNCRIEKRKCRVLERKWIKSCDSVDNTAFKKLASLGIGGSVLTWFTSYLTSRKQQVRIRNSSSACINVESGVPQGSILGPILFLIYVSPLSNIISSHEVRYHAYADDTQLYLSFHVNHWSEAKKTIEACVRDSQSWLSQNMLFFNPCKTEVLYFHSNYLIRPPPINCVVVGNTNVLPSTKVRNIEVVFDPIMKMEKHIYTVCKSVSYHLRNIKHIQKFLTKNALLKLVHALITSRLDYCNAILYGLPACRLNRLQLCLNTAARLVSGVSRREHISPVLHHLHWLPIDKRITFKILLMTYKALHNKTPEYISQLLTSHSVTCSRSLRSTTNRFILSVPASRLKAYDDRAFSVAAPRLWNTLPASIREATSIHTFKKKLKTF
ncbi:uncharacterized protein LOC117106687 [Anneissia japonica]|uniref:uncharacterized protein LOC117106687 n=1 Tax=Anneissia japonica TaxID=1529436 RepID=UPI0014255864|nr:uncharacterized protein LOC117106687 [Anneissia japonica]